MTNNSRDCLCFRIKNNPGFLKLRYFWLLESAWCLFLAEFSFIMRKLVGEKDIPFSNYRKASLFFFLSFYDTFCLCELWLKSCLCPLGLGKHNKQWPHLRRKRFASQQYYTESHFFRVELWGVGNDFWWNLLQSTQTEVSYTVLTTTQ